MTSWLRRLAAPLAAVVLLGFAATTQAATVAFYTTGEFGDFGGAVFGGTPTIVNGPAVPAGAFPGGPFAGTSTVMVGGSTLSYLYSGPQIEPDGQGNVTFGTFTIATTSATPDDFTGLDFKLNIFQTLPTGGSGTLIGTMTGTLQLLPIFGGLPSSDIVVTFNPNTIVIPAPDGVLYTIEPPAGVVTVSSTGPTMIEGSVYVPLPGIAWAGMTLFGMVGGAGGLKRLRRRAV